ncbi:ATP synthase subunit 9, mitochondrial-like [Impatiens glandulifera]|nr:ATP synthase subunit 9, mitochondrial-like [Impatiens glandulifera]
MKKRDENYKKEMLEGAKSIGAGAATIASAGAAVGIGNVLSSSIHSVARNPSLAKQLFGYAILGFALTEAIALFAPMMAFLISSVFRQNAIDSRRTIMRRTPEGGGIYSIGPFLLLVKSNREVVVPTSGWRRLLCFLDLGSGGKLLNVLSVTVQIVSFE